MIVIQIIIGTLGTALEKYGKKKDGIEKLRKNQDHPDHSIATIG